MAFTYEGFLPKRTTWSGTTSGYVEHGFDNDFRLFTQNVNGSSVSFLYDHDGLLTQAGALAITRDEQTGLPEDTALGAVTTSTGYNDFGEPTSASVSVTGNPTAIYTMTIPAAGIDKLGRITDKVETIGGVTTTYGYEYDGAGRLWKVRRNGALERTYTYDDNGNRTQLIDVSAGTTDGDYDEQDRIETYGDLTYVHDNAGDLVSKTGPSGTTTYTYDPFGNLTQVSRPGGAPPITYAIDGQNRRVAKRVNGAVVKRWLYQDPLEPVAELDGAGNVVSRFVYGTKPNVPEYMVQGSSDTFRIISDHLGSVRLVVDASTGVIRERIDYDEFGNITLREECDAAGTLVPGAEPFQPFGLAGGLYDADTGLTRFGARDYDPQIGRWTTKDPIRFGGGDTNLYGYSVNDPINYLDPDGLLYGFDAGESYGADAAQWYADNYVNADTWYEQAAYGAGGLLASLWTPCTSDATFNTLSAASGASALSRAAANGWRVSVNAYKSGGGGINVTKNGVRKFAADWNPFKHNGKMVNRPHYHRGATKSQMKKHRPWQGW